MLKTTPTTLYYDQLIEDPAFRFRKTTDDNAHLTQLRKTLRNTGRLDAILVWREQDKEGEETGRMVVLDGQYRLRAYRAEQLEGNVAGRGIPTLLATGTRVEAELAALRANTKDALPLTPAERTDAAWTLVRRHKQAVSKAELAGASGVSARTIAYMRSKLKEFLAAGEMPSGEWWRDRNWPEEKKYEAPSDGQREHLIATLAASIKEAIREHRIHDTDIKAEALERALGSREMAAIVDHLGYGLDEPDDISLMALDDDHEVARLEDF